MSTDTDRMLFNCQPIGGSLCYCVEEENIFV